MKKRRLILLLLLLIIILPVGITFSKYVLEVVSNYIVEAQHFYFNSDKLKSGGVNYQINNWSGVGTFTIQFTLNDKKNNILHADSDIAYTVSATCGDGAICSLDNTSGTIYTTELEDNLVLTVTPTRAFNDNESLTINVTASSTTPYVKTLSATFTITVGKRGISYEIDDAVDQPYLNFTITNASTSYKVRTVFDTYAVGDEISSDTYLALSAENKAKCASYIVTLTFDPNVVILDTTTDLVQTAAMQYTTIDGVSYISAITFNVDATSSNEIRFYKKDTSQNYTYPGVYATSIITFNAN